MPLGDESGYSNTSFIKIPVGKRVCLYCLPRTSPYKCWEISTKLFENKIPQWRPWWPKQKEKTSNASSTGLTSEAKKQKKNPNNGQRQASAGSCDNAAAEGFSKGNDPRRYSGRRGATFLIWISLPGQTTKHHHLSQRTCSLFSLKWDIFTDGPNHHTLQCWHWCSGTLTGTDVVLGLNDQNLEFDISDLVCCMRLEKHGMVQTDDQYIFCYQVILCVRTHLQAEEEQKEQPQPLKWPENNSLLDAVPGLQLTSNAPGSLHLQ